MAECFIVRKYNPTIGAETGAGAYGIIERTATEVFDAKASKVGDYAFYNYSTLASVNIPNCATIGSSAFYNCFNLTTVNLPNCTSITSSAFRDSTKIKNATLGLSVVPRGSNFCLHPANNSLEILDLPQCTTISDYAFGSTYEYSNLKSVNLPNCIFVSENAFCSCFSLTSINLNNCSYIGGYAFLRCSSLKSIDLPKCTTIGSYAFCNCPSLASVSFPVATTIGSDAFYNCTSLTSVSFPAAITIDSDAFGDCINLISVSFPAATTIGSSAFCNCSRLTSVSFPAATTISSSAFLNCYNLSQLYLANSSVCKLSHSNAFSGTPYTGKSTLFSGTPYIYVPQSLRTSYRTATNWAYFSSYFEVIEDFYINVEYLSSIYVTINTITNVSIPMHTKNGILMPTITVNSDNNTIANVSNITVSKSALSFDIISYGIEGKATITINATNGNVSQTEVFNVSVSAKSYMVEAITGASYGFKLNNAGYYESENKGQNNSYAICKVNISTSSDATMYIDCINYAESNYDYGLLSNLDTTLTLSYSADSSNVYRNFKGQSMSSIQTVTYNVPSGQHYIYIKFIKDSSQNSNNDTLQFKIRFE